MRLSILAAALVFGTLLTAGSSLALVEAIGTAASAAGASADAGMDYAGTTTGLPVRETYEDTTTGVGEAVVPVANPLVGYATQATANAAGQANAATGLAVSIVASYLATAKAVIELELAALLGAGSVQQCIHEPGASDPLAYALQEQACVVAWSNAIVAA